MDLFCRQLPLVGPAVLVGQEAEKCMGPVPGVSPAGVLPHSCSPQPPLNSHSISTIPNPLVGVDKSISCAPKLPPHVQGAFGAEGWDLHSQPRDALSTDPPTCLCQLMEVIFTSFHLEKRRQKSSNNLPGSRSVEEISLAHSQQVILRAAQRRIALARDAEQHLGTPESPTHTQLGTGTCRGQILPTFGIASPPSSPVPAL